MHHTYRLKKKRRKTAYDYLNRCHKKEEEEEDEEERSRCIWQNPKTMHNRNSKQTRNRRELPQPSKVIYKNLQLTSSNFMVKDWTHPPQTSGQRQGYLFLPLLCNIIMEGLTNTISKNNTQEVYSLERQKYNCLYL